MAGTVNQYQQGAFATPINGASADASVVLSNDNATRGKHNSHDADATIHLQSSSLASRPGAGTAQRVWVTTDGKRVYLDNGASWDEVAYLPLAAGGTVTGTITATAFVGPLTGAVTGAVTGNASTATALQTARLINGVSFNGTADITIPAGAASSLTGTVLASNVVTSSLTTVGVLAAPHMTSPVVDSGVLTANGGVLLGGGSITTSGTLAKDATYGVSIVAAAGANYDFIVWAPGGGTSLFGFLTGGRDLQVINGGVLTLQPTSGTVAAAATRFGSIKTAAVTLDTTRYIEISNGGVLYKVLVGT